jgi:hypothetical protein
MAFVIVHRSLFICHCPEIAQGSLGIDRSLRLAMTNDIMNNEQWASPSIS